VSFLSPAEIKEIKEISASLAKPFCDFCDFCGTIKKTTLSANFRLLNSKSDFGEHKKIFC
jgi:hypothetical protein